MTSLHLQQMVLALKPLEFALGMKTLNVIFVVSFLEHHTNIRQAQISKRCQTSDVLCQLSYEGLRREYRHALSVYRGGNADKVKLM